MAAAILQAEPTLGGMGYIPVPANAEFIETRMALVRPLTDEELVQFSSDHPNLRIEQSAAGELIIMPPAFGDTGNWEAEFAADFVIWARGGGGGMVFGPSGGFKLPNGAVYAPDVSWLSQESLDQLPPGALHGFVARCPDFVLELRSHSDRLPTLRRKMEEYLDNGARLGWLIDPKGKQVFVYRPGQPVEHLSQPAALAGESVLAGFTLDLSRIW